MTTYIVECASCRQAWSLDRPLVSQPGHPVIVPYHLRVLKRTGAPGMVPCVGAQLPALGRGTLEQWQAEWPRRFPGWIIPRVLDGAGVKVGQSG